MVLAAGDREAQRMVAVDERARDVVGVDLAAVVVEVLEDLLGDDAALDVDVEEGRLGEHLAEERAGFVERLRRKREREDPVIDLRRREERTAQALEGEVDGVRARHALRQHGLLDGYGHRAQYSSSSSVSLVPPSGRASWM